MSARHDELLFRGKVFQVVDRTADAPTGEGRSRQIVRHPGAVVLLPVHPDGRVVLIENFRVSVGKWLLELPAGTLEHGEEPLQTAHRELAEETGYHARSMELLLAFHSSPGILDERMSLFLATDLEPGPMDLQEGEDIRLREVRWTEAMSMVRDGRIEDAKTLVGLLYYDAFRAVRRDLGL